MNKKRIRFFLFILLISVIFNPLGFSEDCIIGSYFVKNFPPKDYHAQLQNWSIIQDKRGVIYIANNNGVIEYNGTSFNLIKTETTVRVFAVDKDGVVYVGRIGDIGYLDYDSNRKPFFKSLKKFLPKENLTMFLIFLQHLMVCILL